MNEIRIGCTVQIADNAVKIPRSGPMQAWTGRTGTVTEIRVVADATLAKICVGESFIELPVTLLKVLSGN